MTNEEIDIAQLFNVPCKITVNGTEYSNTYKITHLLRFYDNKLKSWAFPVGVCNVNYPKENYTVGPYDIRPVEGWELFIAEKLKQAKEKEVYERCRDKLMCRKVIE